MLNSIVLHNDGKKDERCAIRWAGAFAALLAVLCFSAPAALCQCTLGGTVSTWSVGGNGNWDVAGDWSPNGVPNSGSTSVCITDGSSTVSLNINATVDDLQLASGNTLSFNPNTQLAVDGTQIINAGNIVINGGGNANAYIFINNSMTLSGGGTLNLNTTTTGGGGDAYLYLQNSSTLDNVDNTIQGEGIIYNNGTTLTNETNGIINANSAGGSLASYLAVEYGTVNNTGLLEATNSGQLQLYETTVNNAGGNITANGSGAAVQLQGSDIVGGTLNTLNGGTLGPVAGYSATLDGSTGAGAVTLGSGSTYTVAAGSSTNLYGSIINNGNFQVNGGGNTNGYLYVPGNVALTGGGTVSLNTTTTGGGGNADLYLQNGATLDNVDNTIQGEGIIYNSGTTLTNESNGIINANSTAGTLAPYLAVEFGTVNNAGLLEATNSGQLQLYETTVNNAGGNITANGSGASVQLQASDIVGGTLNTLNGGTLGSVAGYSATLDGSTVAGAVTLSSGSTYTVVAGSSTNLYGSIINKGNIQVNGGGNTNGNLYVPANVTLTGGGTVNLNTTTNGGGGDAFLYLYNSSTLDNIDNTIQGEGYIYNSGTTINNHAGGIINANSAGSPLLPYLQISYGTVNNAGLLEATNNGQLALYATTVNNAGGNITGNGSGAWVQLYNATIQGGTLNNNGAAFFGTPNGYFANLDGSTGLGAVTVNGTYTTDYDANTYLFGSIINNGTLQVNGGGNTNGTLYIPTNVALTGGGTVNLNTTTNGGGGNAFLYLYNSSTLDNVNNTIQGEGYIDNAGTVINNHAGGIINANSAGSPLVPYLQIEYGTVNNAGLLEATNNGQLQLYDTIVNNAGGNITGNGSGASVLIYGSTHIVGGTLNNNGAAFFGTPNGYSAYLDGSTGAGAVTVNGTYTTDYNANTYLYGSIINNGTLQVNGGGNTNSNLYIPTNVTLTAGGTVTLSTTTSGGGGNASLYLYNSSTLDNVDNTIQGEGIIYNSGTTLINESAGTILANSTGSPLINTLTVEYGTVTNNGTLQVNSGNLLHLYQGVLTNFSSNTLTGGTYDVYGTLTAPGTLQIDYLGNTGGEIVNNAATILLDGPNSDFVDAAGLDALSNFNNNTAAGSFTIQNGRNFASPGNFANAGLVTVGNASTFTVGSGASNYNQSAGLTQGIGTIAGAVVINGGAIQPGLPNAPGTLSITGRYSQTGGNFSELMMGAGAGQFGVLDVTGGNVTLGAGADLNITLLGSFNPVGNTYTIVTDTGGTISGTWANAPASGFQMDGINWTIAYNSNDIVLDGVSQVGGLITATWNSGATGNGHWTTASEWSCNIGPPNCVPDNNTNNVFAAVLDNPGNTLKLGSTDNPSNVTIDSLSLQAGTLDIGSGATLNLVNQPSGITDIPLGAGLDVAGTFEVNGGPTSALATLGSVEGTLTLEGQTLTVTPGSGTFNNSGTVNLQQTTALTITGNLTNSNTINLGNGASDTGNNALTVSGLLTNNGTITLSGTGDSLSADLTNTSSINLNGNNDSLIDSGDFNNKSGGSLRLTANLDSVSGNGNFNNNAGASVTMSGSNGSLSAAVAFINGGTLTLSGSANTLSTPSFTNSGTVSIGGNETVTATGAGGYTQTGGNTTVNGTLNAVAGGVSLQAGALLGHGSINGNVNNSGGSVEAASAPGVAGTLTVSGSYTQGPNGTLIVDLGPSFPTHSFFDVFTDVTLGGTVDFNAVGGFTPTAGEDFTFLQWGGSESGNFGNMEFTGWSCPTGDTCTDVFGPNSLTLEIQSGTTSTPEPSTVILFGTALAMAAFLGVRKMISAS